MRDLYQQFTTEQCEKCQSLTQHVQYSHITHDKRCQSKCSKWPLVLKHSLLFHSSTASATLLCWKPAHVLINLCCRSATSCEVGW